MLELDISKGPGSDVILIEACASTNRPVREVIRTHPSSFQSQNLTLAFITFDMTLMTATHLQVLWYYQCP